MTSRWGRLRDGYLRPLRGFGSTAVGNVATLVFGAVSGIFTARGLDPSDRGTLFAVTVWSITLGWLSLLGLHEGIVLFAEGDPGRALDLRRRSRRPAAVQSAVVMVALAPIVLVLGRRLPTSAQLSCLVAVLVVPTHVYGQRALAVLRAAQAFTVWNAVRVLPAATYAVTVVALAALDALTVTRGLLALAAGSGIAAVTAGALARSLEPVRTPRPPGHEVPDVHRVQRFGRQVTVADLPYLANQRLDQLYLSLFAAPVSVGLYSVAVSFGAIQTALATTLDQVLFPKLVASRRDKRRAAILATGVGMALAAVLGVLLIAVAPALIRALFGDAYVAATSSARVLLVGSVFVVASAALTAYGKAIDRVRPLIVGQVAGAAVTLLLLPVLLATNGILGAAVTSTASYAVIALVMATALFRAGPDDHTAAPLDTATTPSPPAAGLVPPA